MNSPTGRYHLGIVTGITAAFLIGRQ